MCETIFQHPSMEILVSYIELDSYAREIDSTYGRYKF